MNDQPFSSTTGPFRPGHPGQPYAGTQQDTLTSFVKINMELVKTKRERDKALATIEHVKALHVVAIGAHVSKHCRNDGHTWPCPTIRALEEAT